MTDPARRRTRDPLVVSRGGELAIAAVAAVSLVLALAALAGLALAAALFGGGWVWQHGAEAIIHTLGGLLSGHPGRGLPAQAAARVPGTVAVYGCVAACELAALTLTAVLAALGARYRLPGDTRAGMATRAEAARVLGARRLRAARRRLRPDLYPPRRRRPQQ